MTAAVQATHTAFDLDSDEGEADSGSLASDEALQALREKLTGGAS